MEGESADWNKLMAYYIIGGDKEIYGPKPGREISDWIREGRLMAESRISTEDSPEWRPMSEFPEFARELKLADEEYGEVENEEYDEGDDELSFPIPWWLWVIKIVFIWPIYWPCWLVWKIVYVVLPAGLVLFVAGAVLDNESLSNVGAMAVCVVGPLGLMLRLYVWAINLRFGDTAD